MHKMGIYSYLYNIYINLSPVNTKTYMKYNIITEINTGLWWSTEVDGREE